MPKLPQAHIGHFIAPLSLSTEAGDISPRRLRLLAAVAETGSISGAAKAVGLTYKAAWDAVDAMNNLAGTPLVSAQHGGRGGGGAALTETGRRVVDDHRRLQTLQQAFIDRLEEAGDLDGSLPLLRRITMKTSARNALHGTVESIHQGPVTAAVCMRLAGGDRLHAIVTRESVEELALRKGLGVQALIKASWVILTSPDSGLASSARNRLCGTVSRISAGEVNAEVVLALSGGNTLAATITRPSLENMRLADGAKCCALIKASHIILGVET